MTPQFKRAAGAASLVLSALTTLPAQAYSTLWVFGDSLSDTGNVLALTTAFTPNPFPVYPGAEGRFSNGPIWVDVLAAGLGLPAGAQASNLLLTDAVTVTPLGALGGQNFAWGGARTGLGGSAGATTGLLGQLAAWNGGAFTVATGLSRAADPNALYVVVAGGNDLRDARSANPGASAADDTARTSAAGAAAQGVVNSVGLLAQAGARHFLIASMPDLGSTPEAAALGNVGASTDVTVKFNAALAAGSAAFDGFFQGLTGVDLDIRSMDLFGLGLDIFDDAVNNGGGVYGITNVSTPCLTPGAFSGQYYAPDAVATNCAGSASSDDLHPTAALHAQIGRLALATAVPEAPALTLVLLALAALAVTRRRPAAAVVG